MKTATADSMYCRICIILFFRLVFAQTTVRPLVSDTTTIKNTSVSSYPAVSTSSIAATSVLPLNIDNTTIQSNVTQSIDQSDNDDQDNFPELSNVHFHLSVPRYYSPYEDIPFLYFVNSSNEKYTNQKKHFFSMHMGSSPYSPTYGLFLLNLTVGNYTFHIGRAFNRTWMADAMNTTDNSTFTQTIELSDPQTTTSYELNVTAWSDLIGEFFTQSSNSSLDRVFLLRAHYKTLDCNQERRIWMYLPPDYESAVGKRYPVIYTHWGQLAFDFHNNNKEWKLDRLFTDAFSNTSSCDALKWGFIIVAIEALSDVMSSNVEYIVSPTENGCRSNNLIRSVVGSLKRHIHANFRTLNQWDYTTMIGYGTAGGLVFDLMTKYFQKYGKFIILSWILDEECCESEVEISDALANSAMFRYANRLNKNETKKNRLYPKVYFSWTTGEEAAEITRARDNAKGLRHRGMPTSNIYVEPVNQTNVTGSFYGTQILKAICWLFNNQSLDSYSDIAPWWDEDKGNKTDASSVSS